MLVVYGLDYCQECGEPVDVSIEFEGNDKLVLCDSCYKELERIIYDED